MSWFAPPEIVETEVFTRLPDSFRRREASDWAAANRAGETVDCFLEGPSFDAAGNLYVTDIPFGRIFRIDGAGEWSLIAEYDGWPNGLKIGPDGRFVIADYKNGLVALDPASGATAPHYPHVRSESFKGINDLVFARNGDIYFTDQGQTGMQDPSGRVYRLCADGRLERLLDTCPSPNGIALDSADRHLYVALTRACQVWRMPISADGIIGKANVFAHTPGGLAGPDGMALDAEDGLSVVNPGHGCVWRLDRFGVPSHRIVSCAGRSLTNLAYHPKQPNEVYITDSDSGQVLRAVLPFAGHPVAGYGG